MIGGMGLDDARVVICKMALIRDAVEQAVWGSDNFLGFPLNRVG